MSRERKADFAGIVGSLRAEATSSDVLDRLLTLATQTLECDHAGATLTVRQPGEQTTLATDSHLLSLADLQLLQGAGPAVDVAAATRPHVLMHDVRADDRWPMWSAAAARAGLRSIVCVQLSIADTCLGTLTAYDATVGHFTRDDVATARFMARLAASAVAAARGHEDLWRVLDARCTIGQAQGILMQRDGLDPEHAFVALQRTSREQRISLRAVAEQLVRAPVFAD